LQQTLAEKTHT